MGEACLVWAAWVECRVCQEWGVPVCQTWESLAQEWRDQAWTTLTRTETTATTKTFQISSEHRQSSRRKKRNKNNNKMRQILRQNAPPPPPTLRWILSKRLN